MRKPSQQLRKLIKSLSQQELKYVRQEIASNKDLDSEQYLRMMDLIFQAEEPYDENLVRKKMKSGYFVTHFSQAKANLYVLISRTLQRYYKNKDKGLDFMDQLAWVDLLSQRDLTAQFEYYLDALAEHANACNSLWMNYVVQQWRVNEVLQSRDLERLDNFILRFSADRQMMLENISRLMYLQESYLRLRRYYMSRGDVTDFKPDDSIRKMFEEVSAMKLDETSPRELRRYRILFRLLYYNCFPVHEEVVQEARDLVEFERLEFGMGKSSSSDLVVSLVRLMYISNSVGCWDEVEAAYHELRKLVRAEQSPWLRRWEIHAGCIIWLLWLRLGKVEQTLKHMEENASEGAAEGLDLSVKRIWYSSHMVAYLWGARYDLLERVALQMEQLLSSSLTDQKFIELRLILMICAYKSNDVVLFNSLYRSSVRAFRKLGFEDLSLKWFCDALNAGRKEGNAARKEILRGFYNHVYQHPEPQSLFIYREKSIFFWIEAEWKGVKVEALFKDADFLKRWPI